MTPTWDAPTGRSMAADAQAALLVPFTPEQTGRLPATKGRPALDYVGHAAVTKRLLEVDSAWTWEPVGWTDSGLPLVTVTDEEAQLWIRLTVCGVTRYGVGTAPDSGGDVPKKLISDALRNAAMRFGVALDLWSKEDLSSGEPGGEVPARHTAPNPPPAPDPTNRAKAALLVKVDDDTVRAKSVWSDMLNRFGYQEPLSEIQVSDVTDAIDGWLFDSVDPVPDNVVPMAGLQVGGEAAGVSSRGELSSRLAVLLADRPSGLWTKKRLLDNTAEIYDLLWRLERWGPDSLVDDLAGHNAVSLDSFDKAGLVSFSAGVWERAETELGRLR